MDRPRISGKDVLAHAEWVSRLAQALVSPADAGDLAQDSWEAALEDDTRQGPLGPWLTGVVRILARKRFRSAYRRQQREAAAVQTDGAEHTAAQPDTIIERLEAQRLVAKLVLELEEPIREVLFLRYYEGLSSAEIGRKLGIPAGTIRWRLKRGIDELRGQLDRALGGRHRWSLLLVPALRRGAGFASAGRFVKGGLIVKKLIAVIGLLALLAAGIVALRRKSLSGRREGTMGPTDREAVALSASGRGSSTLDAAADRKLAAHAWLSQRHAPRRRIAGRVLDAGVAVEGVQVRLELEQAGPAVPTTDVRTAKDGTFDLGEWMPAVYTISAGAPERTAAIVRVDLRDPKARPPSGSLVLRLGGCDARISGRVLESSGGVIRHARLRRLRSIPTETNEAGEFEMCLPRGTSGLKVDADGYGAVLIDVTAFKRVVRNIVLTPEASILGRVILDEGETPVAGAIVRALPSQAGPETTAPASAETDADGRFQLGVSPGEHRVSAFAPEAGGARPAIVTAVAGKPSEITLRLRPTSRVFGKVISGGQPVVGAHVSATLKAPILESADAVSQPDGSFVLERVPRGDIVFRVFPYDIISPTAFHVSQSQEDGVTIDVRPLAAIRGRVLLDHKPVQDCVVGATSTRGRYRADCDADGHYELLGLAAGEVTLWSKSDGAGAFYTGRKLTIAPGEIRNDEDIELNAAAAISGVVVDQDDKPVANVFVIFQRPDGDKGQSQTDAQGEFFCASMAGGADYTPSVAPAITASPFKPLGGAYVPVHLDGGESHIDGVQLHIQLEHLTISGIVRDTSGKPAVDARVRALATGPGEPPFFHTWLQLPSGVTDASGRFAIDGLASGNYALLAEAPGLGEGTVQDIAAGASDVRITVLGLGGIDGTLVGYTDTPMALAQPTDMTVKAIAGQVNGNRFQFDLPEGTFVITAMSPNEGDAQRVQVSGGSRTTMVMTSHGRGVVAGTVVDHATHQPVAGLACRALLRAGDLAGQTEWNPEAAPVTSDQGTFQLDPSPAGNILVSCGGAAGYSDGSAATMLPMGGRATVQFEVVHAQFENMATTIDADTDWRNSTPILSLVTPGGIAARAGLVQGDRVLAIDGQPIGGVDSAGLSYLIWNHPAGSSIAVTVDRPGGAKVFSMIIGPSK